MTTKKERMTILKDFLKNMKRYHKVLAMQYSILCTREPISYKDALNLEIDELEDGIDVLRWNN